jgi:hypothetical protein
MGRSDRRHVTHQKSIDGAAKRWLRRIVAQVYGVPKLTEVRERVPSSGSYRLNNEDEILQEAGQGFAADLGSARDVSH